MILQEKKIIKTLEIQAKDDFFTTFSRKKLWKPWKFKAEMIFSWDEILKTLEIQATDDFLKKERKKESNTLFLFSKNF